MISNAFRSTRRLASVASSRADACSQILTLFGMCLTAEARTVFACSGGWRRTASSQTSSDVGHILQPWAISFLAACILPANSSNRAAAIQPGPCFGLVLVTDLSRCRSFLISPTSVSELIRSPSICVKYPFGSTTVCPDTESETRSSFCPSTAPLPSPMDARSVVAPGNVASVFVIADSFRAISSRESGAGVYFSSFCFFTL
mmetsp:Transcript_30356/g.116410  ORF Transcript_30356/g.116410 Transcript_30356/m.116410 type:complete len:202 (-) Transcript_30356:571-1176(-)